MTGEPTTDLAAALDAMLTHAAVHSPYYRAQDWELRVRQGQGVDLEDIPITPRTLVKGETERFYSDLVPPSEGAVRIKHTSGSGTASPWRRRNSTRSRIAVLAFSIACSVVGPTVQQPGNPGTETHVLRCCGPDSR